MHNANVTGLAPGDDYVELKGLQVEAAAKDAVIAKMREALEETTALCINYEAVEEPDGYQFTEAQAVIKQGKEALAIPNDDSALQERLAQERERCAELAEDATAYTQFQTVEHYKIARFIAAAIRSMK